MRSDKPLINTKGINHITIATSNLERPIDFYVNILGLTFVATWDKGAKAKKLMAENGLDASSFRYLQIVKVENVLKYLQEHNVD